MDYYEVVQSFKKTIKKLTEAFKNMADCLRQIFPESNHEYKDKRRLDPPMKTMRHYNTINHCKPICNKRIKQYQYRKIVR